MVHISPDSGVAISLTRVWRPVRTGMLTAAGFRDVWLHAHPESPGADLLSRVRLRNETASLDQRIDLIWSATRSGR